MDKPWNRKIVFKLSRPLNSLTLEKYELPTLVLLGWSHVVHLKRFMLVLSSVVPYSTLVFFSWALLTTACKTFYFAQFAD